MPRDAFTIEYTEDATGDRRRVRHEPRDDGGMDRIEDVRRGCDWRPLGREPVTDVVNSTTASGE